jgi:hypothetical protein
MVRELEEGGKGEEGRGGEGWEGRNELPLEEVQGVGVQANVSLSAGIAQALGRGRREEGRK